MLSPPDLDLARRDQALPGLATVLDPTAMVAALRHLRPDLELNSPTITYVRYKPGTSCLVGYRMRLGETDILLSAQARHPGSSDKLAKIWGKPGVPGLLGPGRLVIPGIAVAVSVFPNDRRLPQLKRLTYPDKIRSLLRELGTAQRKVRHGHFELLHYRPERRCVAQVRFEDRPVAIVKFHDARSYAGACRKVMAFSSDGILRLPEMLGCSDRYRAVACEWLRGGVPEPDRTLLPRIGEALARLHAQSPSGLPTLTREAQARSLRALARDLRALWPPMASHSRAVVQRLSQALLAAQGPLRPIHGDFYIDQVVAGRNEIGFVDFDEATWGSPAWDLGDFMGHLHYRHLMDVSGGGDLQAFQEDLLAGYRDGGGQVDEREVSLQVALALLRLAPRPFRERKRDWPDRIAAILDHAEALLSDGRGCGVRPLDPALPMLEAALDLRKAGLHIDLANLGIGPWQVEGARVVRHKPGRRCLIEYSVSRDGQPGPGLIGKMRSRGADERAFALQRRLWSSDFGPDAADAIMVPEPVAIVPALGMWLQRKVPGRTLTELLGSGDDVDPVRAATALAKLHGTVPIPDRSHGLTEELAILEERLASLGERRPRLAHRLVRLLPAARSIAALAVPALLRPIHRDFYPDHLLIADSVIYIVDLDLFCAGDAAVDVGNFLAHLTELSLRTTGNPDRWIGWQRGFASAYRQAMTDVSAINIRIYELLSLARLVEISDRMPERRPFTEKLLELCENRVGAEFAYRGTGA